MVAGMTRAEATKNQHLDGTRLMTLLGRYYQLRDDYQNISKSLESLNANVSTYDDLDKGSFTHPLIHALQYEASKGLMELIVILSGRNREHRTSGSKEMKKLVEKKMEGSGSLTYVRDQLELLRAELEIQLEGVEVRGGMRKNWILKLILFKLKV